MVLVLRHSNENCSIHILLLFYWKDFGGSAKVARELFDMLQPKDPDFVTEDEMKERLDDVLKLYLKKKDDDKSGRWSIFVVVKWFAIKKSYTQRSSCLGRH